MSDEIDYLTLEDADLEKMSNYTDIRTNIEYLDRVCNRVLNEGKVDRATMESVERICPESISPDYPVAAYMQDPSEIYVEQSLESINYGKLALGFAAGVAISVSIYLIYKRIKDKNYGKDAEKITKETQRTAENIKDNLSVNKESADKSPPYKMILTGKHADTIRDGWFDMYRSRSKNSSDIHTYAVEIVDRAYMTTVSLRDAVTEYRNQLDIVRDRPSEDHGNAFIVFKENNLSFRGVKRGADRHDASVPEEFNGRTIADEFESLVFKESTIGASSLQEILSSVTGTDEFIEFIYNEYVTNPIVSISEYSRTSDKIPELMKDITRGKSDDLKFNKVDIKNHGIKMTRPSNLIMLKQFTDYINSCTTGISFSVKFMNHYESFLKQVLICAKKINKGIQDQ